VGCGDRHCCLNGEYYDCPDDSALNKCTANPSDPSGCSRQAPRTINASNLML